MNVPEEGILDVGVVLGVGVLQHLPTVPLLLLDGVDLLVQLARLLYRDLDPIHTWAKHYGDNEKWSRRKKRKNEERRGEVE